MAKTVASVSKSDLNIFWEEAEIKKMGKLCKNWLLFNEEWGILAFLQKNPDILIKIFFAMYSLKWPSFVMKMDYIISIFGFD